MRRSISIGRANKIQLTNQLFRPIILLTNRGRIARESGPTFFMVLPAALPVDGRACPLL